MGVEGNFWGLLKPYARNQNCDFLRNKKVAVDLSYWIVQHETALKNKARNPHIRLTFFRTILLFSKLGAFPVFVIDGVPSPLKARARAERFYRFTGIDSPVLSKMEDGVSVERNGAFQKCVRECVELLELLGMPVLKARCEAEALCAQLNYEGHVDACITADSDAFLYGAKCVIKCLRPNSKEPFECYWMSDIEGGLGLKREHLIAISLLAGNDHDLGGVSGIGIETALRFVRMHEGDDILKRLNQVGKGDIILFQTDNNIVGECDFPTSSEEPPTTKLPHCSCCGHPGSRKAHSKLACELCIASGNEHCTQKPSGFKCECSACNLTRKNKEQKKHASWQLSVCRKISTEKNFPNNEIIEMYLSQNHGTFVENQIPSLSWGAPSVATLVDFLWYHQHWDPSYIRQRMLPLLSTNFLREMACNPTEGLLLHGQYEFHSIQRVKVRYGQPCYVVKWRKPIRAVDDASDSMTTVLLDVENDDVSGVSEAIDPLDDHDAPQILVDDGCSFLLTEEHVELVQAAFPEKVARFLQEKEIKESKSPRKKTTKTPDGGDDKFVTPKSKSKPSGVQLSIKEFYRSSKILAQAKQEEDTSKIPVDQAHLPSKEKRKLPTSNLSKSVRRRLLFQ